MTALTPLVMAINWMALMAAFCIALILLASIWLIMNLDRLTKRWNEARWFKVISVSGQFLMATLFFYMILVAGADK
ncbi:MAG: hypothetical protein AAGG45_07675 [Pseudomonadota bacterium]